jgi:hypothetical protein
MSMAGRNHAVPTALITMIARLGQVALGGCLAAAGLALGSAASGSGQITQYYFVFQDAPILVLLGIFFLFAQWCLHRRLPLPSAAWLDALGPRPLVLMIAAAACCVVYAGTRFICLDYGLSLDEFMAQFDSRIIASGTLLAAVAPEWRDLVPALQPIFRLPVPENSFWLSSYLPMNAAIRGAFLWLGDPIWVGVCLAGLTLASLFAVARQLWPDRPDAAVVSVILTACSSQFLIAAMTPYAMSAHLCLNLIWLWLFLRNTWRSHLAAIAVAFVATGLHQVAFHPLFAAPLLATLLTARRWRLALAYAGAYAGIVLFWILYWSLLMGSMNTPLAQSTNVGLLSFLQRVSEIITLEGSSLALMAINLLRFLAWQTPLLLPLALIGLFRCRERSGILVGLALGIASTLLVVLVVMPFQGHGWGYRYLHGLLGSMALLAAQGWIWLSNVSPDLRKQLAGVLGLSIALSVLALLPWRLAQVYAFVRPPAAASAAIARSNSDVVIVDASNIWYGVDLVRNDPLLRSSPKVLDLASLRAEQVKLICGRYRVAIFDTEDAARTGLRLASGLSPSAAGNARRLRDLMQTLGCAHEHVTNANAPQS